MNEFKEFLDTSNTKQKNVEFVDKNRGPYIPKMEDFADTFESHMQEIGPKMLEKSRVYTNEQIINIFKLIDYYHATDLEKAIRAKHKIIVSYEGSLEHKDITKLFRKINTYETIYRFLFEYFYFNENDTDWDKSKYISELNISQYKNLLKMIGDDDD